jgi:hypothetical protein
MHIKLLFNTLPDNNFLLIAPSLRNREARRLSSQTSIPSQARAHQTPIDSLLFPGVPEVRGQRVEQTKRATRSVGAWQNRAKPQERLALRLPQLLPGSIRAVTPTACPTATGRRL